MLMAAALLFFSFERRWKPWLVPAVGVILGLLWLFGLHAQHLARHACRLSFFGCGGAVAGAHNTGSSRAADCLPIPSHLRERVRSAFQPHGYTDSNEFRRVCLDDRHPDDQSSVRVRPRAGEGSFPALRSCRCAETPLPSNGRAIFYQHLLHYAAERGIPTMLALMWLLGKTCNHLLIMHVRLACSGMREPSCTGAHRGYNRHAAGRILRTQSRRHRILTVFLVTAACLYVAVDSIQACGHASA